MARALLVVALTLAMLMPGCLNGGSVESLWKDLEAKPKFQERSLFNDRVEFSPDGIADPDNPPEDQDDLGSRWSTNITIPEGTRTMTVLFTVNFSTSELPDAPLPGGAPDVPDGQVEIRVEGPGNESRNISYTEPTRGGFDFNGPTPGEWTLSLNAVGDGSVLFRVVGEVRVTDTN